MWQCISDDIDFDMNMKPHLVLLSVLSHITPDTFGHSVCFPRHALRNIKNTEMEYMDKSNVRTLAPLTGWRFLWTRARKPTQEQFSVGTTVIPYVPVSTHRLGHLPTKVIPELCQIWMDSETTPWKLSIALWNKNGANTEHKQQHVDPQQIPSIHPSNHTHLWSTLV